MRIACLISTGKDSTYCHWLATKGEHKVKTLVSLYPRKEHSWMFQKPDKKILKMYSKATETPIKIIPTSGEKKEEMEDLRYGLRDLEIDGMVAGVLQSNFQRKKLKKICKDLEIKFITPIWNLKPDKLLKNIIKNDFKPIITTVAAKGLTKEWLGKEINKKTFKELEEIERKHNIHISGEGGEYETITLDAPHFNKNIKILDYEKLWSNSRGSMKIKKLKLEEKNENQKD